MAVEGQITGGAAANRKRMARRIAGTVFTLWVLAFIVPATVFALVAWNRGDPVVNHYAFSYSGVVGGIALAIRKPAARWLRRSPIPLTISFFALTILLCCIEEFLCYVTASGIWEKTQRFYPEFLLGVSALTGWAAGVYVAGRFLSLGITELLFITGLAGWFQELAIFRPLAMFQSPWALIQAFIGLPWAVWSYAILVLIPVSLIPGPGALPAPRGRWWRYPAAFILPIIAAETFALTIVLATGAT